MHGRERESLHVAAWNKHFFFGECSLFLRLAQKTDTPLNFKRTHTKSDGRPRTEQTSAAGRRGRLALLLYDSTQGHQQEQIHLQA